MFDLLTHANAARVLSLYERRLAGSGGDCKQGSMLARWFERSMAGNKPSQDLPLWPPRQAFLLLRLAMHRRKMLSHMCNNVSGHWVWISPKSRITSLRYFMF